MQQENKAIAVEVARAREQFVALVAEIRPELHRYCSRLTGSVVEGEDIVQDALARAFYAMPLASEAPPLRPWLFRIAHNAAIDSLRRYERRNVDVRDDLDELALDIDTPDPGAVHAALSTFVRLPIRQRSAVILKDVLGHSLEEIAVTLDTTIPAVKAALVRGRAALRDAERDTMVDPPIDAAERKHLERYAALFNARDWDGLRATLGEECRLDLVAKAERHGREVHGYFARYANENVRVAVGTVEGHPALLVFEQGNERPSYFISLAWTGDRVATIRDYRYVPYIMEDARFA